MRETPINCGYYNEVSSHGTTTSCRSCPFRLRLRRRLLIVLLVLWLPMSVGPGLFAMSDDEPHRSPLLPLETIWTTDLGVAPAAPPVFDDTRAYVILRDDTIRAISLDDGSEVWTVDQPATFGPVTGDNVIVVSEDSTMRAYLAADGRPLWNTDVGGSVTAPLLLETGWLISALDTGEVVATRAADGAELWRLPLDGSLIERPSIAGGELFIPVADGRIVAVELSSGTPLWERKLGGSPQEVLPLDDLFVGADDNYFYRLERRSGREKWKWRNGGDIVETAAVDERRLYFLSLDNILRSLDRRSGVQQWRTVLTARPTSAPLKVDTVILVSGIAPEVRLFDAETGAGVGVYKAPGELAAAPYIVPALPQHGLRMVVVTGDGRIVGLQLGHGPEQFSMSWPPAPLLPTPEQLTFAEVLDRPPFGPEEPTEGETVQLTLPEALALPPFGTEAGSESEPAGVASARPPIQTRVLRPSRLYPPPPRPIDGGEAGRSSVQVGVFDRESSARTLAGFLVGRGYDAYVVGPGPDDSEAVFSVRVGRSLTPTAATQLSTRLEQGEGLDTLVVATR